MTDIDPVALITTRRAWQAMAEHVLSAALHEATGRIGLRRTDGGFGTPVFDASRGPTQVRVDHAALVVTDTDGERQAPIGTIREAAALVGVTPGAPLAVYAPTTPLDLDSPLTVDGAATSLLAGFFADVDAALEQLRVDAASDQPAAAQLWPEHFDLATTIGNVNYGGSPGDEGHSTPYLYVGPHTPPAADGGFWNEPFGASLDLVSGGSVADMLAFFREGRWRSAELDLSS